MNTRKSWENRVECLECLEAFPFSDSRNCLQWPLPNFQEHSVAKRKHFPCTPSQRRRAKSNRKWTESEPKVNRKWTENEPKVKPKVKPKANRNQTPLY